MSGMILLTRVLLWICTKKFFKPDFGYKMYLDVISPDKARKGVINPLKTGIYALAGISERTFTR